jgi:predicted Zn-dependent protease
VELKPSYIAALFDTLLTRKWTDEIEREAFSQMRELSDAEEPADRLLVEVPALYRLVDSMLANRQAAAEQKLHDRGEVDKLTRTELAKKRTEIRNAARQGLAARLAGDAAKEMGPLAPWLRIERAYLDVQLDQNLADVEAECWKILGEAPPKQVRDAEASEELSDAQLRQQFFDALLRQRTFVTVMNLAARKNAPPTAIDRLLKYVDAGIALGGDMAAPWRNTKFQLLIALDRPDELERALREWIRADVSTAPWRKALAMLLGERGKFDEAISLFEASEKDHLLTAADYRTLADWYMISSRRDAYERSRIEAFKLVPEQYLANRFYGVRNRWLQTDRPLPSELDDNTLFAFRALFEKSANPENYLGQLRDLYAACRDFRLLQMLPDAVVGRSPQQIYAFLENLRSQVLAELHNEATADEITARIKKLREGKLTPTDLRALDLTEALVERRASEVLNQPGPHVAACLAALRRAFDRQWGESEPRMMAGFLRNLETLHDPKLVDEQIRELRALADMAPAASRDHLLITNDLCNLLFWSYGRRDEAIEQMETEVHGYEQAHGGAWPYEDDEVLGSYVALFEGAHRHAAGEAILLKHLAKLKQEQQRVWLQDRLLQLYNNALDQDGEATLGKGNQLFLQIVAEGFKRIDAAADENVRYNIVSSLTNTFDIAQRHKLKDAPEQVRRFAFDILPAILRRQQGQYQNTAVTPLRVIEATLGPKAALQYVVERMEQYPQWLEATWNGGWTTFGNELARLREAATNSKEKIEDLEPRVLKLTIRELKRDLLTEDRRNLAIYYIGYTYFWAAKAGDFANAANEVYQDHKSSGRRVVYIANYLRNGLLLKTRPIEILLVAQKDGVLDESGQVQLVDHLQQASRFGESIPVLEPLVKDHPDAMQYRTRLMAAYHRTHRHDQLTDLVKQTAEHFHKEGRWTEGNIAEFGRGCLDCNLLDQAVGYYLESISLHQRCNPASGVGDATLSGMYQQLAEAQSQLGHTKEAVEAASGAIVSWGPRQNERRDALNKLNQVLANAKDLDAYVRGLDEQSAKTGQDSAIVRKAIGQTYQSHRDFAKATAQFQLAILLQPTDAEAHQALIACYDATDRKPEATLQLLALIDLDPHNLPLYQQLAERLKNDEPEAERAATSIIEAGPHEAENQAVMAELRQKQGRWNEAIPHWEEAAKLRRLEPTNLIKLAEAELHAKQLDAARRSIERLQKTDWPSRFNNVNNDVRRLQSQLPK